jgi:hypothetical protein
MGKVRVSSIWALPRRACFRFQIPTLDHFLSFQFPRTNLKPAQKAGSYTATDGWSSLLTCPGRLLDAIAKYLYRPTIQRKKFIYRHLIRGPPIPTDGSMVLVDL